MTVKKNNVIKVKFYNLHFIIGVHLSYVNRLHQITVYVIFHIKGTVPPKIIPLNVSEIVY